MSDDTGTLPALPTHSPLGASGAERWMNCSGSVALIEALRGSGEYAEDDPDYRRDGTEAHRLAVYCLETGMTAGDAMMDGEFPTLDIEMANAVQMYTDYVSALPGDLYVETRLHRPEFHPLAFGTIDAACVARLNDHIEIVDYKHGAGVVVDVEHNVQTMYYAYLVIHEDKDEYPDETTVQLTIVQPRAEHADGKIRSWLTTAGVLRAWAHEELRPAMERTLTDRYLQVGEWCRFCPAKIVCPAMRHLMTEFVSVGDVAALDDAALASLYEKWEAAKMLGKAVAAEVQKRMVEQGRDLPGLKVVYARVNRVWKDTAEERLREAFGAGAYSEPKLLSPNQVEDAFGSTGKELVAELAYKPQGGYTVAPDRDRRAAVKPETPTERHAGLLAYAQEEAY